MNAAIWQIFHTEQMQWREKEIMWFCGNFLETLVKSLWVNLFSAGFSHFEPLWIAWPLWEIDLKMLLQDTQCCKTFQSFNMCIWFDFVQIIKIIRLIILVKIHIDIMSVKLHCVKVFQTG